MKNEKRKREKEVTVSPPPIPLILPEEGIRRARERARVEERIKVIHVGHWFGVFFAGLTMTVGALLLAFSIYIMVTGQVIVPVGARLFLTPALVFLGIVNIISGVLLMGRG